MKKKSKRQLVLEILDLLPSPSEPPLSSLEKYGFARALTYVMIEENPQPPLTLKEARKTQ